MLRKRFLCTAETESGGREGHEQGYQCMSGRKLPEADPEQEGKIWVMPGTNLMPVAISDCCSLLTRSA